MRRSTIRRKKATSLEVCKARRLAKFGKIIGGQLPFILNYFDLVLIWCGLCAGRRASRPRRDLDFSSCAPCGLYNGFNAQGGDSATRNL